MRIAWDYHCLNVYSGRPKSPEAPTQQDKQTSKSAHAAPIMLELYKVGKYRNYTKGGYKKDSIAKNDWTQWKKNTIENCTASSVSRSIFLRLQKG
jgi:hypothetical protein